MSEPLTMTAEREDYIRQWKHEMTHQLLAEIDAWREAHKRTQEALTIQCNRAEENWTALERVKRKWEESTEQLRQSQEVSKALQNELDNDRRMHTSSRIYCHVAPNPSDIERNRAKEPDGERLRQELTEWIERNGVVSMMLDTPTHYVEMGIAKLPPRIKPILTLWGSIYQIDDESRAAIALAERPDASDSGEGLPTDTGASKGGRE